MTKRFKMVATLAATGLIASSYGFCWVNRLPVTCVVGGHYAGAKFVGAPCNDTYDVLADGDWVVNDWATPSAGNGYNPGSGKHCTGPGNYLDCTGVHHLASFVGDTTYPTIDTTSQCSM